MREGNQQNKYILYARKSMESEDKQVASIDSQIEELEKIAEREGLLITKIMRESHSAKAPGRPVFNQMMQLIKEGKANGIICWKINRLTRNPIDGGLINWLLQEGTIKHIQTAGRSFYPEDNVLMMFVELGMANQFIKDLSTDTKRGLRKKANDGWYPCPARPGYMNEPWNEKGFKRILSDPERFPLIKRVFETLLTGAYRPSQVLDMLNNEWRYRSKKTKKTPSKPMSRSTFYSIISNPFYYGYYQCPKGQGEWIKGKHEPMITESQFYRLQKILGNRIHSRPSSQEKDNIAFYGLFRCGDCESTITPDTKTQTKCTNCKHKFSSKHATACPKCGTFIKDMLNPVQSNYIYYGCSQKKSHNCKNNSLEMRDINRQVKEILNQITISEDMMNWYIVRLNEVSGEEAQHNRKSMNNLHDEYSKCQKQLDRLLEMKISPDNINGNLLSDDDYKRGKEILTKKMQDIQLCIADVEERTKEWMDIATNTFKFAYSAYNNYEKGTIQDKKAVLIGLGSNFLIKNKNLIFELPEHLKVLNEANSRIRKINDKFEPKNLSLDNKKTSSLEPVFSTMLPGWDSNPRPIGYTYPTVSCWGGLYHHPGTINICLDARRFGKRKIDSLSPTPFRDSL